MGRRSFTSRGVVVLIWAALFGLGTTAAEPGQSGATASASYALWDPAVPFPKVADISEPRMITHVEVHRAVSGDYTFLHRPAVYSFEGELFTSWANSRTDENSESEMCRGRRSRDGGLHWGPIETIAPGFEGPERHSHGAFFVWDGRLYAPVSRFGLGPALNPGFPGLKAELFVWQPDTRDCALEVCGWTISGPWKHRGVCRRADGSKAGWTPTPSPWWRSAQATIRTARGALSNCARRRHRHSFSRKRQPLWMEMR